MNEEFTIILPKLGESILSATIVQWFKKVGDEVSLDEPLLEVSTDKVNSEIPSPVAGVIKELLAGPDEELQVGEPLAVITLKNAVQKEKLSSTIQTQKFEQCPQKQQIDERKEFLSPAVLLLASEKGISIDELKKMSGSGAGGRITKQDVEAYSQQKIKPVQPSVPYAQNIKVSAACSSSNLEIERLKMSGMRKAIAENMVRSFYEAPHATLVHEVDVTNILNLIQKEKEDFFIKHGVKLTVTSFVAKAIAKALQEFPLINSSLEDDTILVKRFVNLGIAVSIDQGLIVPVIKNCQRMGIISLATAIYELSQKARTSKLSPDDINDGTITMTNFGMSGVSIGVPIIRYPEVAIIGVGAIQKKVIIVEEDKMAIRSMMHICLTFDHRVLDGMYGCGFLSSLKKHLENDLKIEM